MNSAAARLARIPGAADPENYAEIVFVFAAKSGRLRITSIAQNRNGMLRGRILSSTRVWSAARRPRGRNIVVMPIVRGQENAEGDTRISMMKKKCENDVPQIGPNTTTTNPVEFACAALALHCRVTSTALNVITGWHDTFSTVRG